MRPGLCRWNERTIEAASYCCGFLRTRAETTASALLHAVFEVDASDKALAGRVRALLPLLSRSLQASDPAATLACLAQLIGLGPGLTPAGDDFVIGWLAGLTLTAVSPEQRSFLRAVCAGIAPLQYKTTLISWQHLDDARAGLFSERLSDVCVSIAAAAPAPVIAARLGAQLAVGASSGADAAAGLLVALRHTCPEPRALLPNFT